jgi:hypothetical protein
MAKKQESAERPADNIVRLFGEEIELVRPRGVAGLKFMPKAHRAYRSLLNRVEPAEKTLSSKGATEILITGEILSLIDELITTEEFVETVLPGLYMYSTKKLSYKQAIDHINEQEISTQTTGEIFEAFMRAMNFWGVSSDPEALDTALKKSTDDKEAEEEGE